ncbi:uncharacterized protein C5L36_0B01140 [Pichia kudriavzevii]|uniref:Uncharacterized protein n=1 Tax=Pichia kudriavzevii TaxID=4909 RepID=A0A2U9R0N0_PICKU|nr:uncharacterized protein C5L36_0B01140 [Pichia kudriavzevii]AWU74847.1 hypothetical protein C5L36_0B01140 [Pichia kudriavzevii]
MTPDTSKVSSALRTAVGRCSKNPQPRITLSTAQIVLVSLVFTILQEISTLKLNIAGPVVCLIILLMIAVGTYSIAHQLPLSTSLCRMKLKLVVREIRNSTQGVHIDICTTITVVLLAAWILSVWKSGTSFLVWCFVVWIYNLSDRTHVTHTNTVISFSSSSSKRCISANHIGSASNDCINIQRNSAFDHNCLTSSAHINQLEAKIFKMEKKLLELEDDKVQLNLLLYAFNHNLNDKFNHLEKTLFDKTEQVQSNIFKINASLSPLKRKRKHVCLNIVKLYFKCFLIAVLPRWVIIPLKRLKKNLENLMSIVRTMLKFRRSFYS